MRYAHMLLSLALATAIHCGTAQEASIVVHADQTVHRISPYLTGACIEDVNHEVYGGIDSQMIFGESFANPYRRHRSKALPPMVGAGCPKTVNCTRPLAMDRSS